MQGGMQFPFTFVFPMSGNATGPEVSLIANLDRDSVARTEWYIAEVTDEDGNPLSDVGPVGENLMDAILHFLMTKPLVAQLDAAWVDYLRDEHDAAAEANAEFRAGAHW